MLTKNDYLRVLFVVLLLLAFSVLVLQPPARFDPSAQAASVYSILSFGATSNDNIDDTSAIQSAINAACAAPGSVVDIPAGTYIVRPLRLCSNITLQGERREGSILRFAPNAFAPGASNATAHMLIGRDFPQVTRNLVIRNLTLDGNAREQWGGQVPAFVSNIVHLGGCDGCLVEQVTACNALGDGIYLGTGGQPGAATINTTVQDVLVCRNMRNGISHTHSENNLVQRVRFAENQYWNAPASHLYGQSAARSMFRAGAYDFEPNYDWSANQPQVARRIVSRALAFYEPYDHALVLTRPDVPIDYNVFEDLTFERCGIHCIAIFVDGADYNVFRGVRVTGEVGSTVFSVLRGDDNCLIDAQITGSIGAGVAVINGDTAGEPALDNALVDVVFAGSGRNSVTVIQTQPVALRDVMGVSVNGASTALLPAFCASQVNDSGIFTATATRTLVPVPTTTQTPVNASQTPAATFTPVPGLRVCIGVSCWDISGQIDIVPVAP